MTTHTVIDSPIGPLTLVRTGAGLAAVYLERHKRMPDPATFGVRTKSGFDQVISQFDEYFAGTRTDFDLPCNPHGTPFQLEVWAMLRKIPYGETRTYGQLAEQLGDRQLARAVGSADARNPLSVIVPCHRVIAASGALTGYAGGLDRKQWLLDFEAKKIRSGSVV